MRRINWLTKMILVVFVLSLTVSVSPRVEADSPPRPKLSTSLDRTNVNLGEWLTITVTLQNNGGSTMSLGGIYLLFPHPLDQNRIQVLSHNLDTVWTVPAGGDQAVLGWKTGLPAGSNFFLQVKVQPSATGIFLIQASSRSLLNNQLGWLDDPRTGPKNSLDLYYNPYSVQVWPALIPSATPTQTLTPIPTVTPQPTAISAPTATPLPVVVTPASTATPVPTWTPLPTQTTTPYSTPTPAATPTWTSSPALTTPSPTPTATATSRVPTEQGEIVVEVAERDRSSCCANLIDDSEPEVILIPGIPNWYSFQHNLSEGASSEEVQYVQILLNRLGFSIADSGPGSPGNETTYFGQQTEAAVVRFQEAYSADILTPWGLTKGTGYLGKKTMSKLNELLIEERAAMLPAGEYDDDPDDYEVEKSDFEEFWENLDSLLNAYEMTAASTPIQHDDLAFAVGYGVKKGTDRLLGAYRGSQRLRFLLQYGLRTFRISDETLSGYLTVERHISKTSRTLPYLKQGWEVEREAVVDIGLWRFECIECVGRINRPLDGILAVTTDLGWRTIKNGQIERVVLNSGDILEIKNWGVKTLLNGLHKSSKFRTQIKAQAGYARKHSKKVVLSFKRSFDGNYIRQLEDILKNDKVEDVVQIVNGF